jgi:cysteine synthase
MSTGTGGTLAGVSMFLKEKNSRIRTVLADPPVDERVRRCPMRTRFCCLGQRLVQLHTHRQTRTYRRFVDHRRSARRCVRGPFNLVCVDVLGIGQGRVTANLQDAPIDESIFIADQDSVNMVSTCCRQLMSHAHVTVVSLKVFRLLFEEGFFVGASSGLNVAAAVQLSRSMPKGSSIVTCLCDNGQVRRWSKAHVQRLRTETQ